MTNKTKVKGVHTAIVTPMNASGELDENGLRANIRFQIKNEVDGIVALGTTGEAPTLSDQEKSRIMKICAEEINGKALYMVGTGSYATQQTIENTLKAEQHGADMALIVSPYYNKPTQEGIYRHFKAIADAVNTPIVVYNIAGRTGLNIQTDTLKRLADLPRIVGVKEASGNIIQMCDVIETLSRNRPDFSVMSGDDSLTLALMAMGGHGVISVLSNLVPASIKALVRHMEEGKYDQARTIHYELAPLFRAAFIETNPIPIKAAMDFCGMAAGGCRLPLCGLSEENAQKLKAVLKGFKI